MALSGMAAGYSFEEKLALGLLPAYPHPPFQAVAQLNHEIQCCEEGTPPDWPKVNTSAHELTAFIAFIEPSVYDVREKNLLTPPDGNATVFLTGRHLAPASLWNTSECQTDTTRFHASEEFAAWEEADGSKHVITTNGESDDRLIQVTQNQSWESTWPDGNETLVRFNELPEGHVNFSVNYSLETNYTLSHYKSVPHYFCTELGCITWYTCEASWSETRGFFDSVNDSRALTVELQPAVSARYFIDGSENRLRLDFDAPDASEWELSAGNASAGGQEYSYAFDATEPPYNISRVLGLPHSTVSTHGLKVIRGTLEAQRAHALLASAENLSPTILSLKTPFREQILSPKPSPQPSLLAASPQAFSNGTGILFLSLSGNGVPLAGEKVSIEWMGSAWTETTDSFGRISVSQEHALGSQATAWYDSDGRFASQEADAFFDAPRSSLSQEEDALFFLGGMALLASGLAFATGRKPETLMPWLGKALVGGLAVWLIAKTVSA